MTVVQLCDAERKHNCLQSLAISAYAHITATVCNGSLEPYIAACVCSPFLLHWMTVAVQISFCASFHLRSRGLQKPAGPVVADATANAAAVAVVVAVSSSPSAHANTAIVGEMVTLAGQESRSRRRRGIFCPLFILLLMHPSQGQFQQQHTHAHTFSRYRIQPGAGAFSSQNITPLSSL